MKTLAHNTAKHISKLTRSIDNKLFDLLIDLDDQLAHGYEQQHANLLLKYFIMHKILLDNQMLENTVVNDHVIQQNITLDKMKDNYIKVQTILNFEQAEPGDAIKHKTMYHDKTLIASDNVAKKYEIDMVPLYRFFYSNKIFKLINVRNKFKNLQVVSTGKLNFINYKPKNFKDSLKYFCPIDENSSDDDEITYKEMKKIRSEYTKVPFIMTNPKNEIHEEKHQQQNSKFGNLDWKIPIKTKQSETPKGDLKQMEIIPFIGVRSINHKDKDRDKYKDILKMSAMDVD